MSEVLVSNFSSKRTDQRSARKRFAWPANRNWVSDGAKRAQMFRDLQPLPHLQVSEFAYA